MKLNMFGGKPLFLIRDPELPLEAATKQYVDNNISTHSTDEGIHLTSAQNTFLDGLTISFTEANYLSGVTSSIQTQLNNKLALTGGTLTGSLTLSGAPTASLHATTKQYVDDIEVSLDTRLINVENTVSTLNTDSVTKTYVDTQDATKVAKSGDTMTGLLTLSSNPTANLHAATKQYVDTADSALDTRLQAAEASITTLEADPVTKTYVDTQDATKVAKAGSTMTGSLILHADPTANLQAATKQYVDTADDALDTRVTTLETTSASLTTDPVTKTYVDTQDATKVAKSGDTMTGLLTLSADPTGNLHAATKQYVDTADNALDSRLQAAEASITTLEVDPVTKTYVDTQDATKVAKAGDTMTGSLILHADPSVAMQAATKQYVDTADNALDTRVSTLETTSATLNSDPVTKTYVDTQDATKVAKSGDTMTGFLTLSANPTANLHAATKQYVDSNLSSHATDATLHLTSQQNTLLDALTASSTELNYLSGTTSNVQSQLDSKLSLSGGEMTGSVVFPALSYITLTSLPLIANHAANKAYVDNLINGLKWKSPIVDSNLVAIGLTTPPVSPVDGFSYLIGIGGTGDWAGLDNHIITYKDGLVVDVLGRAVQAGDRIGVGFESDAGDLHSSVSAFDNKIISITGLGPITFSEVVSEESDTILVTDSDSNYFGNTYTYTDSDGWIRTSAPISFLTGNGLSLVGKTLNVNTAGGLAVEVISDVSYIKADVLDNTGLILTEDGINSSSSLSAKLAIKTDNSTITVTSGALALTSTIQTSLSGKVDRSGDTLTGSLILHADPTANLQAATKQYVDSADDALDTRVTTLETTSASLNTDPVTKTYVDTQDATKVAKSGDTMTGLLTLSANPTANLHAATKQYVDTADSGLDTRLQAAEASITTLEADPVTKTYVDTQDATKVAKSGDTMTGLLTLSANPTANLHAATKQYVDSADDALDTRVSTLETTSATLNSDPVTKTYVDTQDATKVAKAGDTMTGLLTLSADPTGNLHAATKQYVDSADSALDLRLQDAEASITTLEADPVTKTYVDTQDATKVAKAGSTMTGFLTLHADPTANLQAATKQYVDTADSALDTRLQTAESTITTLNTDPVTKTYVDTQDATKVAKAGDTMTGFLTLSANPTTNLHAATKQYVDSADSGLDTRITILEGEAASLTADPVTKTYVDTQDATKVAKAGDSMTGFLTLSANPTANLHAATKQYVDAADNDLDSRLDIVEISVSGLTNDPVTKTYVDTQDATKVAKAGDTMTGLLTLSADPTGNLHAATKQYVDSTISSHASNDSLHITPAQNTLLDSLTVISTELNYLSGSTSNIQSQLDSKVSKSGSTMTGALILHSDPAVALQAATKQYVDTATADINTDLTSIFASLSTLEADPVTKSYVDNADNTKVAKAGDSMTGYLSLVGAPTQPLHAATKQYVDNVAQGLNSKPSVRYATTSSLNATYNNGTAGVNSTLIGNNNGNLVIDGFAVIAGDRVLVKSETNAYKNGCYLVQQAGDSGTPFILKRVETIDESSEVPGSYFYVYDGLLKGTGWLVTVDNPDSYIIGTDDVIVNQFSGAGSYIAGAGLILDGTTFNIVTASQSRIVVATDHIDLATSGVVAGTYTKLTVDAYGRAIIGANPSTLAGYGITDAQPLNSKLTSITEVTGNGLLVKVTDSASAAKQISASGIGLSITNGDGTGAGDIIVNSNATSSNTPNTLVSRDGSGNITVNNVTGNLTGNASTATALANSRNFSITGDVTAPNVSFDGTGNVTLNTTLADNGVTPGTFTKVSVDSKGRVTLGDNPTTLAGYGIVDAATLDYVNTKFADLEAKIDELHSYIMSRIG